MHKTNRLLSIEEIIRKHKINAQVDILRQLKERGMSCTQATLSRDLRQLGVCRVPDGSGGYRYSMPDTVKANTDLSVKFSILPVIQEIIEAKGMLVIKTLPGNASNIALFIDNAGRYEIVGTIAGDDTILLIPRDGITSNQLHACLEAILPGLHSYIKNYGVLA
jgi:transcriptional regulator of arginine metabolism